jgi:hypothetical protein
MTAHVSLTLGVLGCATFLLAVLQACSGEPHTAIAPPVKIDAGAPPGEQGCICPPQVPCPSCPTPTGTCPEPAVSANRTPEPCKTDMDCSSRFCDRGICGPLRTGSLSNASECTADRYCQSGLCDRGVCTSIGGIWNGNHGEPCEPLPPFAQRIPNARRDVQCSSVYICLDGRCRSCTSDAECVYWLGEGTCEHVPGLPGKLCWSHPSRDPKGPNKASPARPP